MPRDISVSAQAKVGQQLKAEPIVVFEIQWVKDGGRLRYADRDIPQHGVKGRVNEISNLDAVIQVSQGSDSSELTVVLVDPDSEIKDIMDHNDIHLRPVWVYQWFDGLDYDDKFLLFKGYINSPVAWNEGDRTVSFDVLNRIEDAEVGFSMDEGDFDNVPAELVGKPWPLCFGTCINVPSLRVKSIKEGTLAQGVGIKDPTLAPRLQVARAIVCPFGQNGWVTVPSTFSIVTVPRFCVDPSCRKSRCELIEALSLQLEEQTEFEFGTVTIYGGENFPQAPKKITLDINGGKFFGRMNGDQFTITGRRHPDVGEGGLLQDEDNEGKRIVQSACEGYNDPSSPIWRTIHEVLDAYDLMFKAWDMRFQLASRVTTGTPAQPMTQGSLRAILVSGHVYNSTTGGIMPCQAVIPPGLVELEYAAASSEASGFTHNFYSSIPTLNFFWAQAGSKVTLDSFKETIYIANILPSTIHRVASYRTIEGVGERLLTVPSSYYTTRVTDFNGYMVTEIVFDRPLSSRNKGWSDDIYVTLTSTVGPNTVDILEWLIETYTDFEIDSTSFDYVRDRIENYPSHFPLLDRHNIIPLLQDIAFQARCALWLNEDRFFIKYLAEEPDPDDTMTVSDMENNTIEVFHTDTEDLVTKYVIEWQEDYALDEPNKVILRHNVSKYGTHEETKNFFIYNIYQLVVKSATFWLIRKSNTWKKLRFSTYFNKLKLETMDCAEITLAHLADVPIPAICENASYNSETRRMDFEFWTPVKAGTMVPYDFAFPADVDEKALWPTQDERNDNLAGSGRAPNFSVIAPKDHPLDITQGQIVTNSGDLRCADGSQSTIGQGCRSDHGDSKPSDTGDQKPEPRTPNADVPPNSTDPNNIWRNWVFNQFAQQNPTNKDASNANQQNNEDKEDDGGFDEPDDGGDDEQLPNTCGGNCAVTATLRYGVPTLVHRPIDETPYFKNQPGDQGVIVFINDTRTECHTFNSMDMAKAFVIAKQAEIDAKVDAFGFTVGTEELYQAGLNASDLGTDGAEYLEDGEPNPNFGQPCDEPDAANQQKMGYQNTDL